MPESQQTPSEKRVSQSYERKKVAERKRSETSVRLAQDIGQIPPIKDVARRQKSDRSFRHFCESYFPHLFKRNWSEDHLRVIAKCERVVRFSETFALAMPRGSGKTTLCRVAVIWAIVTGKHHYVMLINGTEVEALRSLKEIKEELAGNKELASDYPEAIYPIQCLDGETRRANGQRYFGRRTQILWGADEVNMPVIPGSRASGACIRVAGINGHIRGQLHRGKRPTLAIVDDPQTDQSARSPLQIRNILSIINGTIGGLAGPGERVGVLIPCTVIRLSDVADQLLDRTRHPQWQGERTKCLYSMPSNMQLWGDYFKVRTEEILLGGDGKIARQFYIDNQAKLEAGAVAAWPERFSPENGEVSAIQHAMHLWNDLGHERFDAEYQNQPHSDEIRDELLTAEQICSKTNRFERRVVPENATVLTAFVDVQKELLYYIVCGWQEDFTGYVLDYGSFPDQKRRYFTLRDSTSTLSTTYKQLGLEARLFKGLETLTDQLLGMDWKNTLGHAQRIDKLLVDANWGTSTNIVYNFCQQSRFSNIVCPSHGRYIGASSKPMYEWAKKPGDRLGPGWRLTRPATRAIRHVTFDTNYWKSFSFARLAVQMGDPGCLSLWGDDPERHVLLADHLTAEYAVRTEGRGRVVDEWKIRPERSDNHLFDCIVGSAVAASMCGISSAGHQMGGVQGKKRITAADLPQRKGVRR